MSQLIYVQARRLRKGDAFYCRNGAGAWHTVKAVLPYPMPGKGEEHRWQQVLCEDGDAVLQEKEELVQVKPTRKPRY